MAAPRAPPHEAAHRLAAATLLREMERFLDAKESVAANEGPGLSVGMTGSPTNPAGAAGREVLRRLAANSAYDAPVDDELLGKAERLATGAVSPAPAMPGPVVFGPLTPILGAVYSHVRPESEAEIPISQLSFAEEDFLPGLAHDVSQNQHRYRVLAGLLTDAVQTDYPDPVQRVEQLLSLSERVLSSVSDRDSGAPSDVSIFDRARVAAAFASCLAVHGGDPSSASAPRFRLVTLGLGGIQSFIFRHISPLDEPDTERGRTKQLRGRSFYVTLLTTLAARRLLEATGLPAVNMVLDAGGRVMLLLPVSEKMEVLLANGIRYVREWFASHLAGAIRMDLTVGEVLDESAFDDTAFAATFRRAGELLEESRLRLPMERFQDDGGWLDDAWVDTTFGLQIDTKGFQEMLERLGGALPKAKYVAIEDTGRGLLRKPIEIVGYPVELHLEMPPRGTTWTLGLSPELSFASLITANHVPLATVEDVTRLETSPSTDQGEVLINSADDDERPRAGTMLTFSHLACLSVSETDEAIGHAMLGALKADVDHLGLVTGYGLGHDVSLARVGSLSRSLDLFFKGFLTEALQTRYPHVYTVFSGGDDLFLIGPWYDLVRFLPDLHEWFRRQAARNPHVTVSAGLAFTKAQTPVRELARAAEGALDAAKEKRNQITIGTTTLSWDGLNDALELHRMLYEASMTKVKGKRAAANSSLVYRLQAYAVMAQRAESRMGSDQAFSMADLKWRAQLAYDLKRNLPTRQKSDAREDPLLLKIHKRLMQIESHDAGVLRVAAMLTLYRLRGN
jgi:CRISPR-associated protein Csm1